MLHVRFASERPCASRMMILCDGHVAQVPASAHGVHVRLDYANAARGARHCGAKLRSLQRLGAQRALACASVYVRRCNAHVADGLLARSGAM